MKLLLLLLGLAALASAVKWHQLEQYTFSHFKSEFRRDYATKEEHETRRQIFEAKLKNIKEHNKKNTTWKMGVNHFTDRTDDEFRAHLGLKKSLLHATKHKASPRLHAHKSHVDVSHLEGTNVDWRSKNIVSAVKDQGQCGSCWTFATAESVESAWAMATGKLVDLSEQQILDCTANPNDCGGSGGCGGGTAELALDQIIKTGGLATEWTYPYQSYSGTNETCKTSTPFAKVQKYVVLKSNDYADVLNAIATVGPLAISVDASAWSQYESGIFDGCNYVNPDLDHAVQLVGFGTDPKLGDYWLVRNSWSPNWGEEGYIRLRRNSNPPCGTDITPLDGDGCTGGPPQVKVCGECGILYDTLYVIPDLS